MNLDNDNIVSLANSIATVCEEKQGIVKKVLAIDMNFIMFPCIKLYFENVNPEENSSIIWNSLDARNDINNFLSFDKNTYMEILKLLLKTIDDADRIWVVEFQKDIINELTLDDDGIMYDIINIDFYHDLFVDLKKDKQRLKHFNKYNDINWIGYIDAKEKLFNYEWISAPNSVGLDHNIKLNMSNQLSHNSFLRIPEIEGHFDEIYISYSPNYVPYQYRYLTDILKTIMFKNMTNLVKKEDKE